MSEGLLLEFLQGCPNLKILEIHQKMPWRAAMLLAGLKEAAPKLIGIVWDIPGATDEILAELLGASTRGWREVSLAAWGLFGPLSLDILMGHSTSIESLVVEGMRGIPSEWILQLLRSSPNLKRLCGFTLSRPRESAFDLSVNVGLEPLDAAAKTKLKEYGEQGEVNKDEGIASKKETEVVATAGESSSIVRPTDWACRGLQYIALQFKGLPRSDISCSNVFPVVQWRKSDQERAPQRPVYTQLGALIELRELVVGHGQQSQGYLIPRTVSANTRLPVETEDRVQSLCLSFSLASSLGRLSRLKKLVILDVSYCTHKIGLSELEWMHLNWPLLMTIIGLLDYVGVCVPDTVRAAEERKVRTWMVIHNRGIRCSCYESPGSAPSAVE